MEYERYVFGVPASADLQKASLAKKVKGMPFLRSKAVPCSILQNCATVYRIYLGCDTGPMHIATAVALPSVVLFGSGNPSAYGPRSPGSRIVSKYENGKLRPMSDITIEDALAVVEAVLSAV